MNSTQKAKSRPRPNRLKTLQKAKIYARNLWADLTHSPHLIRNQHQRLPCRKKQYCYHKLPLKKSNLQISQQTSKPHKLKTCKPFCMQTSKPAKMQAGKPVNL